MKTLLLLLIISSAIVLVVSESDPDHQQVWRLLTRDRRRAPSSQPSRTRTTGSLRSPTRRRLRVSTLPPAKTDSEDVLEETAQTTSQQKAKPRLGYSGTVHDGRSSYILKYNDGVPIYGAGEPYYYSYTHNFPIATSDFQNLVNSHNLPSKYKFSGGLDVTGLLE